PPFRDRIARRQRAPRREKRRLPRAGGDAGVGVEPRRGALAYPPDRLDVRGIVDPRQALERTRIGTDEEQPVEQAAGLQMIADGGEPRGALGMPGAVAVPQAILVIHEGDRRAPGQRGSPLDAGYFSNRSCAFTTRTRSRFSGRGKDSISLSSFSSASSVVGVW